MESKKTLHPVILSLTFPECFEQESHVLHVFCSLVAHAARVVVKIVHHGVKQHLV